MRSASSASRTLRRTVHRGSSEPNESWKTGCTVRRNRGSSGSNGRPSSRIEPGRRRVRPGRTVRGWSCPSPTRRRCRGSRPPGRRGRPRRRRGRGAALSVERELLWTRRPATRPRHVVRHATSLPAWSSEPGHIVVGVEASTIGGRCSHRRPAWPQRGMNRHPGSSVGEVGHRPGDHLQRPGSVADAGHRLEQGRGVRVRGGRTAQRSVPLGDLPGVHTTTRSQTVATTPRSWVISTIAVPRARGAAARGGRICAWIVTSSAVVGSSAMISAGSFTSAAAITTRWRMPPLRRCGGSP